jgi:hypothetical protein
MTRRSRAPIHISLNPQHGEVRHRGLAVSKAIVVKYVVHERVRKVIAVGVRRRMS